MTNKKTYHEMFSCEVCTNGLRVDIIGEEETVLYRTPLFKGDEVEIDIIRKKGKGCE